MAKAKEAEREALPPLVITPEKGLPVGGNFQAILGYLTLREKEVARMKLSEDSLDQAKLIKKEAAAYRKAVEDRLKTAIALLFDGPKDVLKAKAQELFKAIERIESSAEKVLDQAEEARVADLNLAFESYKESFQALYRLGDDDLAAIEFRKWYYNKTPPGNEKKAKDDLEQQFKDRRKAIDAHVADVEMIQALCDADQRLSFQSWLDRLEHVPASVVAKEIAVEKERLAGLDRRADLSSRAVEQDDEDDNENDEEPVAAELESDSSFRPLRLGSSVGAGASFDDGAPLRLGVPESIVNFKTDFPGRTLKKGFEMEYPCDMGDLITELFKELRQHGIVTRALKAEVAF
jgi:hypothetical protein